MRTQLLIHGYPRIYPSSNIHTKLFDSSQVIVKLMIFILEYQSSQLSAPSHLMYSADLSLYTNRIDSSFVAHPFAFGP